MINNSEKIEYLIKTVGHKISNPLIIQQKLEENKTLKTLQDLCSLVEGEKNGVTFLKNIITNLIESNNTLIRGNE